jgi:hypothetical protein
MRQPVHVMHCWDIAYGRSQCSEQRRLWRVEIDKARPDSPDQRDELKQRIDVAKRRNPASQVHGVRSYAFVSRKTVQIGIAVRRNAQLNTVLSHERRMPFDPYA